MFNRKNKPDTSFKRFFIKAIRKHFPRDSNSLIQEVDERFTEISFHTQFASKSSNPLDKRLDFAAYFLALIQSLENRKFSYEEIKNICLEITYDYVSHLRTACKGGLKGCLQ